MAAAEQLSLLRPALVWPPQVGAKYVVHWPRLKNGRLTGDYDPLHATCVEPRCWPRKRPGLLPEFSN